jgi:hypothetical protein
MKKGREPLAVVEEIEEDSDGLEYESESDIPEDVRVKMWNSSQPSAETVMGRIKTTRNQIISSTV